MTKSFLARVAAAAAAALLAAATHAAPAAAQVQPGDTLRRPLAGPARADTARPDTARPRHRISPRGAFLRSLVIPGWGQSEIGAPERGAVYFALEAGSLWMVYKSNEKLAQARERQEWLRATGQIGEDQISGLVRDRKAQREDWITLSVFWLFFSGADAFVSAYLRDFDASVGVAPDAEGAVRLQATVPLGRKR